jgi:hypothetical protein
MKKIFSFFTIASIALLAVSCYSGKKAQMNQQVQQADSVQKAETKIVEDTKQKVDDRLKAEVIDAAIADSIKNKIAKYSSDLDSFKNAVSFIDKTINTSRRAYKSNQTKVDSSFGLIDRYKSKSNYRLRRFTMINESLDIIVNQQHMFDLAAFFGPGKYDIPSEKIDVAEKLFSPLVDSLVGFYKKYADVEKRATLVILGYADGSGFNPESDIYKSIMEKLKDSSVTKEKMNQQLSEWRAVSIGDLMEFSIEKKIPNYKDIKQIEFLFIEKGKGEEYPSKLVTDYKVDDERRRVVLLFWNILPK